MRRGVGRAIPSNLPVPKASHGTPVTSSSSLARGHASHAKSAEDLSHSQGNTSSMQGNSLRRALSPGIRQNKGLSLSPARTSHSGSPLPGVRYITEDLIRKIAREEHLEVITSLNLTLSKEGGKKIKFIENLDRLKNLVSLNLSNNMIERMEKLEKLQQLRELNLSRNYIVRIEGLETLTGLQVLNLSSNSIEHIPTWLPKRLQALRTFRIANNKIVSLSEMAKLKTIPDLIHIDIKGNPLSELPHARLFLVFHLRCMETLDSQAVTSLEREQAQSRFSLDEVQNLERQLEQGESRYRQLEESHNRSEQERSQQEVSQNQLLQRQQDIKEQLQQLQRELAAKDDLLKQKTTELNRACEKHYQLEQELAFHKIDSKFKELGTAPPLQQNLSSDDGGLLSESPYIGRARFHANQMAEEGQVQAVPQRVQLHSLRAPVSPALSPQQRQELQGKIRCRVGGKKERTEEKLRMLQSDLNSTEQKLVSAAQELKKLAPTRNTPEPFRDDKFKIRQRLAKKMQNVNKLRDAATQMEDEIDRVQQSITQGRAELNTLKNEMQSMDPKTSSYQMADKELQVKKDYDVCDHLQQDLHSVMQDIAKETTEIKHLEEQLESGEIERNESIKAELEDIVSDLQGYLEGVKGQTLQHQQEYRRMMEEKGVLEEKIRRLETELDVLDTEAQHAKVLQKRLEDAEHELSKIQNLSQTLQEDLLHSRQKDQEAQSRLEQAEAEIRRLNQSLQETEKKAQSERKSVERHLQTERERMEKMTQRVQDANRQDLEVKKLVAQLEAAKTLNSSLRDQLEDVQQQRELQEDGFKPSELKKRLRKFTHDFKTNKSPGEPFDKDDILGTSFKEIYQTAQDKLSKTMRESEEAKKQKQKLEVEVQTLKEQLNRREGALQESQDNKHSDEEKRRLQEEIKRLQASLKQLKEGGVPVRIVYARSEGSVDRASSLDSEEKMLFDELQRELMELKRHMRQQEHDASRRLVEVETEAAQWQEEMKEQKRIFEKELDRHRQEAELLKEKQEARIQVIAQDLDQAQSVAEALQQMLNQREKMLQDEIGAADMSNQMIASQEDELSRLYGILDAQRAEIENLNQMLDYLAAQGPDGVGPAFDDELWRIRQEVNKLKETLAMQSAYVQSMPATHHFGMQAGPLPPLLQDMGVGSSGIGVGHVGVGPSSRSSSGTGGVGASRPVSSQPAVSGFATGLSLPGYPADLHVGYGDQPDGQHDGRSQNAAMHQRQTFGGHPASTLLPRPAQRGSNPPADPRSSFPGHLANERRESKAPPSSRRTAGKGEDSSPAHPQALSSDRVLPAEEIRWQAGGPVKRGIPALPSAFEPVHRPERQNPAVTTSGIQGPSRSVQVGVAAPAGSISEQQGSSHGGVEGGIKTQPMVIHVPVPIYMGNPPSSQPTERQPAVAQSGLPVPESYEGNVPTSGNQTHVAFDPIATQYSYSAGGTEAPTYLGNFYPNPAQAASQQAGVSGTPGAYNIGTQTYLPVGPAQQVDYQHTRTYIPAGTDGGSNARIYYPPSGSLPMPAPGAPPPPPPLPVTVLGPPSSPGSRAAGMLLTPIATGTPVRGGYMVPVNFDGSYVTAPPSPIRPVAMDSPSRGILKNGGGRGEGGNNGDDSYLFCNVPEHHDLEDYIAELQEKLRRLKAKLLQEKSLKEEIVVNNDKKLIKRLLNELEDRREELEGLDLAIERQKRNLQEMKDEEKGLKRKRSNAREELQTLRERNIKRLLKMNRGPAEDSFDEEMEHNRQKYLRNEVDCLERTLAKRQAQLHEAERALKDCNADLREAKEQARETVKRYDDATMSLQNAVSEQQEIERRANEVGLQLVQSMDRLAQAKISLRDLERKRIKQDRLLKDINQVIAKKDTEFRDLDARVKVTQQSLQKVQDELVLSTQQEKEVVDALRDSEDVLGKRRAEIARMRDQVVYFPGFEEQAHMEQLELQKSDLATLLKARRLELHKLQEEELQHLQQQSAVQVAELQNIAERQFRRANALTDKLGKHRQEVIEMKTQIEPQSDDKENEQVSQRASATLAGNKISDDWTSRNDRLRQRLVEEQDYLRLQLKQQMSRHSELMESARKKSDETINHLKQKLNSLQEVLFNSGASDVRALQDLARSRSQSPRYDRRRSPSPIIRTGRGYWSHRSRSRSFERINGSMIPERDCKFHHVGM
ncbi:hypothetical protein C0Q70_17642 [Pomacea canaliculata]|uniref:Centriolin n=1 Tax=Pomacea canaliculata TaxID=400727 RepID=A0A2T7NKZ5_POMCA|nr:hypothetical protein C0Q70_17642 [Pomacea canaliculata]